MIGPILAMAIAASAPQSTTPRDGILNGGFEGVLAVTDKPLRTAFWVVGEEDERSFYIPEDPGGYYLGLQRQADPLRDQIAYQMVGCPLDKAETAEITGWVYLPSADSEARVSVSAAGAEFWSLHWVTKGTFFRPGDLDGHDLVRWEVWQSENGSNPEQFTYTTEPDPQANAIRYKFIDPSGTSTVPNNSIEQQGPTRLQMKVQSPAGGYIEVRWIAPRAGWVRAMNRPYFFSNPVPPMGDPDDFDLKYEIFYNTSTTPIVTADLDSNNGQGEEGIVLVERIWVEEDDQIRFRASKKSGMSPLEDDAILFGGQPVVAYEGNTVTYRIGVDPDPIPVSDTDEEKFINVTVASAGWRQIDMDPQTSGIQPLPAGADLQELFYSETEPDPVPPPLCVKLSAPALGANGPDDPVGFDEIACMVEWNDVSVDDLRAAILEEARWMRDNQLGVYANGILDDEVHGWLKGSYESAYATHKLFIRTGPVEDQAGNHDVQIREPVGLWDILKRQYDDLDYDHFFSIWEKKAHPSNVAGATGFTWEQFDTEEDLFLTGQGWDYPMDADSWLYAGLPNHYPLGVASPMERMMEIHRVTNDPWYLERAYDAALVYMANGVYEEDPPDPNPFTGSPYANQTRSGMIAPKGYEIDTGEVLTGVGDLVTVFGPLVEDDLPGHKNTPDNLNAVTDLLEVYSAKTAGNPSSETALESACGNCIETCKFFRNPAIYFAGGDWHAVWQSHDGEFNDHWGYQSRDAVQMRQALLEVDAANSGLSSAEEDMLDLLESAWLVEGTQYFYAKWAQVMARNEFVPGDHPRGWLAYLHVIQDAGISLSSGPDREDFEDLLKTAAFHALKFQHVGGIWNSGGLGRFQQADLGSVQLGPPAVYITGIANALELPNLTSSEEEYLLSAVMAILEATQRHFKANDIGTTGEAGVGDGYGYWGDLFYREPAYGGEWLAGQEGRPIGAFLDVLDALERTHPPTPARPEAFVVSPTSGQHTSGSVTYEFKLVVPGVTSDAELITALETRTRLIRWEGDSVAGWAPTEISTAASGGPLSNVDPDHATDTITFELANVAEPGDGERFKFVLVTWDTDLRWDQDTTVQED